MEPFFPPPPRPYSPYAPLRTRARPNDTRQREQRRAEVGARSTTPAECEAEIERIGRQLARVVQDVPWGRVQNDAWDGLCPFIFRLRTFDRVRVAAEEVARTHALDTLAFTQYALRRWYCFWGARLSEQLFIRHPNVAAGPAKDHEVDFTIDGVPFDLKTSELPRAFAKRPEDLIRNPAEVADWFYRRQSRERRFHAANRLFLVLHDPAFPEEAWRLRADVEALRARIDAFLAQPTYLEVTVPDLTGALHAVQTAIILVEPLPIPRQLPLGFDESSPRSAGARGKAERSGGSQLPLL
ncbi:MAG TPA: hypothetical protein VMW65_12850 [Chloroflexota bacterium]|nr:hypothetical protein [Chloroflexota bacterium]